MKRKQGKIKNKVRKQQINKEDEKQLRVVIGKYNKLIRLLFEKSAFNKRKYE